MGRALSIASLVLGVVTLAVWIANAVEIRVLHPTNCSIDRLQLESWLLLARAAALVSPFVGLVAAGLAFGAPPRLRGAAATLNTVTLAIVAGIVAGWVPLGHLPCLRS